MVKTVTLFLLALCLSITGFAQVSIYKTWIGEQQEYLELNKGISKLDLGYDWYEKNDYKILVNGKDLNIIRIPRDYQRSEDPKEYHFEINRLTNDTLILTGIDSASQLELRYKSEYIFVNKASLVDSDLAFQKIEFSSSFCMGNCPQMHLAIDSTGKMHFFGGAHTKTEYKGMQIAQLSPKQIDELIKILKESCLDKLPEELLEAFDVPSYNFIISYNNRKIKTSGWRVPYPSTALLHYLLNIYLRVHLNILKIPDGFEFE